MNWEVERFCVFDFKSINWKQVIQLILLSIYIENSMSNWIRNSIYIQFYEYVFTSKKFSFSWNIQILILHCSFALIVRLSIEHTKNESKRIRDSKQKYRIDSFQKFIFNDDVYRKSYLIVVYCFPKKSILFIIQNFRIRFVLITHSIIIMFLIPLSANQIFFFSVNE